MKNAKTKRPAKYEEEEIERKYTMRRRIFSVGIVAFILLSFAVLSIVSMFYKAH